MPSRKDQLSISEETKIVALIARGDTYDKIREEFKERGLTNSTIGKVKKRNAENLELIRQSMLQKSVEDAMVIKQKANKKLSQRLDSDDKTLVLLEEIDQQFLNGEMDYKQYHAARLKIRQLSVSELVSISKEMHNQSQEAEAAPVNPSDAEALLKAIKEGDEVTLNQLIWKRNA